ncbi:MAG: hypothetical protein VZR11_04980 [Succinimonas sp.]|nr:hypothetical protein [Succinimonas sp.]
MKIFAVVMLLLVFAGGLGIFLFTAREARAQEGPKPLELSFHSFDGGGPSYHAEFASDIAVITTDRRYKKKDHEKLRGAGYDKVFIIAGKKPGSAFLRIREEMPHGNPRLRCQNHDYELAVSEDLRVTVKSLPEDKKKRTSCPDE